MHGPSFVEDLAIVLGVAGITGLCSHFLKQPSVLGYLFAGLLVGPYLPIPLFADRQRVESLSEFGVILVMFAVGLEFRIERFLRVLPTAGLTALVQISVLFTAGYALGQLFGWPNLGALFLGACICISSTMAVSKILERHPVDPKIRELMFGVLVLQDVAAVVLIAIMTALSRGAEASFVDVLFILAKLMGILAMMLAVGMFVIPRFVRALSRTRSSETLVVGTVGICFSMAILAQRLGYSSALGAFIGGVLVAESGQGHRVERASRSVRDVFAAVFFVSVGMTVNPVVALHSLPLALAVLGTVIVAQLLGVLAGGVLSGSGFERSVAAGLGLGQIGEFAFILASIGASAHVVPKELRAILVVVAMLSIFTTSLLLPRRDGLTRALGRLAPERYFSWLAVYETWLDKMRTRSLDTQPRSGRFAVMLAFDFALVVGLILAWRAWEPELGTMLARTLGFDPRTKSMLSTLALVVALVVPLVPLAIGARHAADYLASRVFEQSDQLGYAPLRAVLVLLATVAVGLPLALLLGPILGVRFVWPALGVALLIPAYFAWKKATKWDHQLTSSGLLVLQTIADQGLPEEHVDQGARMSGLSHVRHVALSATSFAVGQTLTQLQLRSTTGASVIAIVREGASAFGPSGDQILQAGDVLLVAGGRADQIAAEQLLLSGGDVRPESEAQPSSDGTD